MLIFPSCAGSPLKSFASLLFVSSAILVGCSEDDSGYISDDTLLEDISTENLRSYCGFPTDQLSMAVQYASSDVWYNSCSLAFYQVGGAGISCDDAVKTVCDSYAQDSYEKTPSSGSSSKYYNHYKEIFGPIADLQPCSNDWPASQAAYFHRLATEHGCKVTWGSYRTCYQDLAQQMQWYMLRLEQRYSSWDSNTQTETFGCIESPLSFPSDLPPSCQLLAKACPALGLVWPEAPNLPKVNVVEPNPENND